MEIKWAKEALARHEERAFAIHLEFGDVALDNYLLAVENAIICYRIEKRLQC